MSIQLVSVSRTFGTQAALKEVSLEVRRGDCYGFIGHNGAGKTTAMRIALGLIRPSGGRVLVDGFDARAHPREARARMGGLIEVPGFHPGLGGPRNLVLLARLQGLDRAAARREAGRLMELMGLEHAGSKPVRAYSQGMRQRLGIAQALLGSPPYVLLDEPTNGLDPEGIAEIRRVLRRLGREEATTVLISSHQLHELAGLCTRVGVLRQGELVVEEETEALFARGSDRYLLDARPRAKAVEVCERMGLATDGDGADALRIELGELPPQDLARELVEAGVELASFAPRPPSLEEIYLRFTRGGASAEGRRALPPDRRPAAAPSAQSPRETRAPGLGTLRALRYELSRLSARAGFPLLLALPALVAVLDVLRRAWQARGLLERVEDQELYSATAVTAFEGVGVGLRAALPIAAAVVAGVASQSLAGELSRGTLRNALLRPVHRLEMAAGKLLGVLVAGLVTYLVLVAAALVASTACFDFGDVVEALPNGATYPLVAADELWPELRRALLAPLLPLAAYVGLGFLAGGLVRGGAGALALALGALVSLDLARAFARGPGLEGWLPSAYLPSPLGDTSFLGYFADAAEGVSNASFAFADTALLVPGLWLLAAFALASIGLLRRAVP